MASSPSRRRSGALLGTVVLGLAFIVGACGGGDGGGGGGDAASAAPAQTQVTVTPETAATPFALQAGRYKFGWTAPACKGVDFTMTGKGQGFVYAKKSGLPTFNAIVSDVPEDIYTLTQANAACTAWTVQIDKIGG